MTSKNSACVSREFERVNSKASFWVEEVDLKIPSVILQYHRAIETCLQDKFPEYEIHVDDCDL